MVIRSIGEMKRDFLWDILSFAKKEEMGKKCKQQIKSTFQQLSRETGTGDNKNRMEQKKQLGQYLYI